MTRRRAAVHPSVDRLDHAVADWLANRKFPVVIERGMPILTRAADHSVLWMVIAGGLLATRRRRPRRAAARGLASIAVSSLLANQFGKRLVPRQRPLLDRIPLGRIARRVPASSSFPSGHSASAAAFAVGASLECPPLAIPLGAAAVAVAASRVYTGVHYVSDVAAGATIGAAVATGLRLLVPAHTRPPHRPGSEPPAPQPPRPTGQGLVAVYNPKSGHQAVEALRDAVKDAIPDAELVELREGDDARGAFRDLAKRAEVIGVVGGDGTVNAAATVAAETGLPLLVIAGGTFNHFAKDLGLAEVSDSVRALQTGQAVQIDVADANGHLFVNTASLGSYPDFVEVRERWEKRFGKPIAAAIAVITVLRRCPPLPVRIDGAPGELAMLFVGSNVYEPRNFAPRWRPRLDTGQLDVRYVEGNHPSTIVRLVLAALFGRAHRSARFVERATADFTVTMTGDPGEITWDGEVSDASPEVHFTMRRNAITVYRLPTD